MRHPIILLLTCFLLAGCASAPAPESLPIASAAPVKPALSGVLAASLGKGLDATDQQTAFDAQLTALEKGQKQTWRGKHGTFGFVEPGAASIRVEGACREYTHKIYIAGRPQSGHGVACRAANGDWNFVS